MFNEKPAWNQHPPAEPDLPLLSSVEPKVSEELTSGPVDALQDQPPPLQVVSSVAAAATLTEPILSSGLTLHPINQEQCSAIDNPSSRHIGCRKSRVWFANVSAYGPLPLLLSKTEPPPPPLPDHSNFVTTNEGVDASRDDEGVTQKKILTTIARVRSIFICPQYYPSLDSDSRCRTKSNQTKKKINVFFFILVGYYPTPHYRHRRT